MQGVHIISNNIFAGMNPIVSVPIELSTCLCTHYYIQHTPQWTSTLACGARIVVEWSPQAGTPGYCECPRYIPAHYMFLLI